MGYGFYNTMYIVNLRIVQIRVVSLWRSFVTTAQKILVVSSRIENQRGHRVCRMSTIERLNVKNTHATQIEQRRVEKSISWPGGVYFLSSYNLGIWRKFPSKEFAWDLHRNSYVQHKPKTHLFQQYFYEIIHRDKKELAGGGALGGVWIAAPPFTVNTSTISLTCYEVLVFLPKLGSQRH